jgi:hypothetical protein
MVGFGKDVRLWEVRTCGYSKRGWKFKEGCFKLEEILEDSYEIGDYGLKAASLSLD